MISEGSQRVLPHYGAVSTAKAALESANRQLVLELGSRGILVNCINAGVTDTPTLHHNPGNEIMIAETLRRLPRSIASPPLRTWPRPSSRSANRRSRSSVVGDLRGWRRVDHAVVKADVRGEEVSSPSASVALTLFSAACFSVCFRHRLVRPTHHPQADQPPSVPLHGLTPGQRRRHCESGSRPRCVT